MSKKITRAAAEKLIPKDAIGIAYTDYCNEKKKVTYAQFLQIPTKNKDKVRTRTYWRGFRDGPSFKGGIYTDWVVDVKINGKYTISFHTVNKYYDNGKDEFVCPTRKNSSLMDQY